MKKIFVVLALVLPAIAVAQNGALSPYGQYGVGVLADQSTGFNRGMSGGSYGMHESNQVNYLNPASYANMDSLTFIFDVGASLQVTNFSETVDNKKNTVNGKAGNFEYAVAGFRVRKGLGMSFGVMPFSKIDYSYDVVRRVSATNSTIRTSTYSGEGGLRQVYIGAGWNPWRTLTVGMNVNYIWGKVDRSVNNYFSDATVYTLSRSYFCEASGVKLDFGAQYTHKLNSENDVTMGVTFTPGMKLSGDYDFYQTQTNPQASTYELKTTQTVKDPLFVPTTFGVGFAWYHAKRWRVGLDYTNQGWGGREFADYRETWSAADNKIVGEFGLYKGILQNRSKFAVGGEFVNNPMSRKYLDRVHVRAGLSYATPYVKINGKDGPGDFIASLGFGLPITNMYNNRSILNISAQYCRTSADGFIKENTFRINIGLTFNERWFMKWKVE